MPALEVPAVPVSWREQILSKDGPHPTVRLVLLGIDAFMASGQPRITHGELSELTGLSVRTIVTSVQKARISGWLVTVKPRGFGRAWAGYQYEQTIPSGNMHDHVRNGTTSCNPA